MYEETTKTTFLNFLQLTSVSRVPFQTASVQLFWIHTNFCFTWHMKPERTVFSSLFTHERKAKIHYKKRIWWTGAPIQTCVLFTYSYSFMRRTTEVIIFLDYFIWILMNWIFSIYRHFAALKWNYVFCIRAHEWW